MRAGQKFPLGTIPTKGYTGNTNTLAGEGQTSASSSDCNCINKGAGQGPSTGLARAARVPALAGGYMIDVIV